MALMWLQRTWIEGWAAVRSVQVRPIQPLAAVFVLLGLLTALESGTASAVEVRDAEIVAGGFPVLQNGSGTVRLVDARMGRLSPPIFVPEPGVFMQLVPGIGLLTLLARRRKRRTATHRDTREPGPADFAT